MKKKRAVLVVETLGWAFENIAKQIIKAFGDRYDFKIIARESDTAIDCDIALFFWWKSALRARPWIRSKRTCIGLYDHWSVPQQPARFQEAVAIADCFFVGNEKLLDDVRLRAPDTQIELTEDGVDLDLFKPLPYPDEFTVGWTGNRIYETLGLGDLKGVRLIEAACEKAGVKLLLQDKQQCQIPQAEMPEKFYRNISCYVCASAIEGTPNPVLEALACGRQVVSTDVGIVSKLLPYGREARACWNGRIVRRTVEDIATGIHHCQSRSNRPAECINSVIEWSWAEKVKAFAPVLEGDQ